MLEYHKIDSVFKRDPDYGYRRFILGDWTTPAFEALKDMPWISTEKVDGTNVRINWDGEKVTFGGRTARAQMPVPLMEHLIETFPAERMLAGLKGPLTLIGEGYGGKIQGGSYYRQDQSFILFDAFVEPNEDHPLGIWLERDQVEEIADALSVPIVPIVFEGNLWETVEFVTGDPGSVIAQEQHRAEGVVARPAAELRDRLGRRVITKVKCRDFD